MNRTIKENSLLIPLNKLSMKTARIEIIEILEISFRERDFYRSVPYLFLFYLSSPILDSARSYGDAARPGAPALEPGTSH